MHAPLGRNVFWIYGALEIKIIIITCTPVPLCASCPVRSTEDLFTSLEENQVKLSTMKASRFVKAFEHDVDYWERTLSHIMEVIELLLTIQRQWMYLDVSQHLLAIKFKYLVTLYI